MISANASIFDQLKYLFTLIFVIATSLRFYKAKFNRTLKNDNIPLSFFPSEFLTHRCFGLRADHFLSLTEFLFFISFLISGAAKEEKSIAE